MNKSRSYHKWTKEDIVFLEDNFQNYSRKELAEKLNVTWGAAKRKYLQNLKSSAPVSPAAKNVHVSKFKPIKSCKH